MRFAVLPLKNGNLQVEYGEDDEGDIWEVSPATAREAAANCEESAVSGRRLAGLWQCDGHVVSYQGSPEGLRRFATNLREQADIAEAYRATKQ